MENNRPVLYTRDEVAEILKVSLSTIARMIKSGKIDYVRIGKSIRISSEEVKRLEKEGTNEEQV